MILNNIVVIFILMACSLNPCYAKNLNNENFENDKKYRELIIGEWGNYKDTVFIKGNDYIIKQYFYKNGDLVLKVVNKANPEEILETHKLKWKIQNGKLYEHVSPSNFASFDVSDTVDELLYIDSNYFKLRAEDNSILYRYKVKKLEL